MFSHLPAPVLDTIISLSAAYQEDTRSQKVDLGIGVYKNSQGHTPIMQAISAAQTRVTAAQTTKAYVGIAGCEHFNQSMTDLVLADTSAHSRVATIQTPGASGGLRMFADLIKFAQPESTIWLSNPSYVNHAPIMEAAGLDVKYYAYFNPETKTVDKEALLTDLAQAGPKDVVLLHGCCHNPTGADMDFATWQAVTALAQQQGFTPFVDAAYLGFGDSFAQDSAGLRYMADHVDEMMLTVSCSKNFGLYRERTGAAMVIAKTSQEAANAKGKLLNLARSSYTMPPDHGAALVRTVLQDDELKASWMTELSEMQHRLLSLRQSLCKELRNKLDTSQFDFIEQHKGMFSVLGLTPEQMTRLREEFAIYGVTDGRINIAGLTEDAIPYVADSITKVC
ncbi:aromatic amino acid transaminase [Vibrio palustris]|uniref:Aromatic-amino-acid aminotransferase n=1 Tax=Vibrio palustris TaxID=1918946 RepID=A0A1R4B4U5_9VIBR|nr:amino acid aminotransferase [Vibrio palustris]SJL83935.1 Aromatic-amino-acid aminotransferase [Vibrio palustris]